MENLQNSQEGFALIKKLLDSINDYQTGTHAKLINTIKEFNDKIAEQVKNINDLETELKNLKKKKDLSSAEKNNSRIQKKKI